MGVFDLHEKWKKKYFIFSHVALKKSDLVCRNLLFSVLSRFLNVDESCNYN